MKIINEKGFTLIEAMISAAVLAIGILATLNLVVISINGQRASRDITVANSLAKQVMENMKNVSYSEGVNLVAHTATDGSKNVFVYKTPWTPDPARKIFPGEVLKFQNVYTTDNRYYVVMVDVKENSPKKNLAAADVKVFWGTPNPSTTTFWIYTSSRSGHKISYSSYFNM